MIKALYRTELDELVEFQPVADITAGTPVELGGGLWGVPANDVRANALGHARIKGSFAAPKATPADAFAIGQLVDYNGTTGFTAGTQWRVVANSLSGNPFVYVEINPALPPTAGSGEINVLQSDGGGQTLIATPGKSGVNLRLRDVSSPDSSIDIQPSGVALVTFVVSASVNLDFENVEGNKFASRATIASYVTTRLPVKSTTPVALTGTDDATFITPLTLRAVLNAEPDEGLIDGSIDLATLTALPAAEPGDWFRVGTTATIGGVIFTADEWYKNETGAAIAAGSTVAIATAWTKTKDAGVAVPTADGVLLDDGGEVDLATLTTLPAANLGDWFRVGTTATIGGVVFTAGEWWKNQTGVALASGATAGIASSWTRVRTSSVALAPTVVTYTGHLKTVAAINTFVPFAASYDPDGAGFDDGAGGTTNIHLTDGEFAVDPAGAYILDGANEKIPAPHNVVVVSVPNANSLGIVSGEKAGGIANAVGFTVPAGLKRAHTYYVQPDGTTGEPYTEFPLFQVDEDAATVIRFHQDSGLGVASSGTTTTTHTPVSRRCETGNDCEVALDNDTTIVNAFVPAATTAAIEKTIQITHSRFGALVRGIDYAVAANDADLTWLKPASPLLASDIMEINYIV